MLALLSLAQLLGMSPWFTAAALAPQLSLQWHLGPGAVGALTAAVQLGFVAGTACAALLNLADLLPSRTYFAGAALLAAAANAGLLVAHGFATGLALRFLTGFFLAGVYPPGMKMVATWFSSYRGLAIGTLVGALTVGKATPYLVHAFHGARLDAVVLGTSGGAVLAAALVGLAYRDGRFPFPRRTFSWGRVGEVLHHRETRLAIGGYLGHMWELYAMWTWLPAFLAASAAARAAAGAGAAWRGYADALAFAAIAAGGLGCVWGGWAVQRAGYARVVNGAMAASGACAVLIGFCYAGPGWLLALVALCWGFFVVADSAQFSAMVTESAPPHAVGTALTLQTSMGFLLTMLTIQLVPLLAQRLGWSWAFPVLALGPACGIAAIARIAKGNGRRP
jgi:MFS family permease